MASFVVLYVLGLNSPFPPPQSTYLPPAPLPKKRKIVVARREVHTPYTHHLEIVYSQHDFSYKFEMMKLYLENKILQFNQNRVLNPWFQLMWHTLYTPVCN